MSKADIELLFGVKGGGRPSGDSGAKIKRQLDNIINNLNKKPLEVAIQLDKGHLKNFQQQLSNLTNFAVKEAGKIQAAYNITFPTPPTPPPGGWTKRKSHELIKPDTTEMKNALALVQEYRTKIDKILTDSSGAKTGSGKDTYEELEKWNNTLRVYEDLVRDGIVYSDEFAEDMGFVSATMRQARAEFKLLGEDVDNHSILPGSTEMSEALAKLQAYRTQIKKMQSEWTAASAPNSNSAGAMASLGVEDVTLNTLEANLRHGAVGANDFADAMEHAGAVIKQVSAEVKYFGENKSIIDLSNGSKDQFKALAEINKLLSSTKKNLESWSSAAHGITADDYEGLKSCVPVLEELHKNVLEGKISFEDYQKALKNAKLNITTYSSNIKHAGKDTRSFSSTIKDLAGKFSKWFSVTQAISGTIRTIKQMVSTVTELDTAMTELRKVTEETEYVYDNFLKNASTRAKELGATLTDVVSASADFARLGHGLTDASTLADAAIVYKNVGDGIEDIGTASKSIISTMQAFQIEAKKAMSIVDAFNAVGNKYAVSSAGVGEALLNSAAALSAAGNSIHESVALIAAANTTIQDPSRVGTALKTVSDESLWYARRVICVKRIPLNCWNTLKPVIPQHKGE